MKPMSRKFTSVDDAIGWMEVIMRDMDRKFLTAAALHNLDPDGVDEMFEDLEAEREEWRQTVRAEITQETNRGMP